MVECGYGVFKTRMRIQNHRCVDGHHWPSESNVHCSSSSSSSFSAPPLLFYCRTITKAASSMRLLSHSIAGSRRVAVISSERSAASATMRCSSPNSLICTAPGSVPLALSARMIFTTRKLWK